MELPYVSIVSGTYNRIESLKRFIKSIRSSIGIGVPYEIVIVDGGSNDGSILWLKQQPDVVLIEQGELLGACKAFNAGFTKARGKYVIIGNDDIEFRYESILNSIAFMDDHPDVGIGCFNQNRHSVEYTCDVMPVVINGHQTSGVYGQVCIVPKWLGDKVGWWGDYHTYAGDNELSCNVLELGFKIEPMEFCCINDFQIDDGLRKLNNQVDHYKGAHPDSQKWRKKWTKNGILGARVQQKPLVQTPLKRVPRLVYAPLYEDSVYPIQLKTKFGLRKALSKHFLVSEVNYRHDPDSLYYMVSMFNPDVVLIQYHTHKLLPYDLMNKMREEFPKTLFVSWNGDYSDALYSKDYMFVLKLFHIATFVCGDVEETYLENGINYKYWQIGYEEYDTPPETAIQRNKYDAVFLGNCYSKTRQRMGEMLRFHKEWKTALFGRWPTHIKSDGDNQYDFAAGDILYRSSKIAIGDCGFPNSIGYVSNRLFQALHAGAFLLQQNIVAMTELLGLEDGKHLIIWENQEDLEEKLIYWLDPARDSERARIAQEGKKFVDKYHSFDARVEEFMQMIAEFNQQKLP